MVHTANTGGEVDILGDETAEGWLISPNYFFPVVVAYPYCKHVVFDSVLLETLFQWEKRKNQSKGEDTLAGCPSSATTALARIPSPWG
jgi:hypothetical protein